MNSIERPKDWLGKFSNALRGWRVAVLNETSFWIHLPVATAVVILAWVYQATAIEWGILLLCIGIVLATEMVNSAIEQMAQRVTQEEDALIKNALDMAAGAVLATSVIAAITGATILLPKVFFGN